MPSNRQNPASDQGKSANTREKPDAAASTAEFVIALCRALDAKGWTAYRLHKETGLSERHLENMAAGRVRQPRPATIQRIADSLGISPELLMPGVVKGTEYVVFLSPDEQDVLFAAGAFDRIPMAAVLRRGVEDLVQVLRGDQDIQKILEAMASGRRRTG